MQPLDRLLRPRSIAVVGGGAWCANIVRQCAKVGYEGAVWPVHPARAEVGGQPTMKRLADLPHAPDATFIGVNREATVGIVDELSRMGAGGAVCFAAGFREAAAELADGADLQARLVAAAGDMPILGPNCYGFLNYLDGAALWPDQHGGRRVTRGVAIVTQSSNIAINLTMQRRGLPIAYVVTAGNQAQTGLAAIGRALLEDSRVTALGLHVEGIGDLRAFEALAAAARDLGKPIVALKVGASESARAATVSHTASLAGSDAGAEALFARLGIARVKSLAGLLEALKLLHVAGPLPGGRLGAISCSGGEASLIADSALGLPLSFPELSEPQRTGLRAALGPKVALANPLDYHTYIWGDPEAMGRCFAAMAGPEVDLVLLVVDFPREDRCDTADWEHVIAAVAAAKTATGARYAVVSSLADTLPEARAEQLVALGIAPLSGLVEGLEAIVAARTAGRRDAAAPILLPGCAGEGTVLSEAEAKARLASHGLVVPRSERAASPDAAAEAATRIGFPVVVKGEGTAHKTEAGLVALGLADACSVVEQARAMAAGSFLVEEMVADGIVELLVGVVADPAHGYVLTLGAGGVLTEVLADTASLLVPASEAEVAAALSRLRMAPVLAGHRGRPAADMGAVVAAVMAVQDFVIAGAGRVAEVEVNPLIAAPGRAVAADALIRMGGEP